MIREYGPIFLVPSAWLLVFLTMGLGITEYWIEHMHYFMLLFMSGFIAFSWKEMGEDPVLDIWRKVIVLGIFSTGLGALGFLGYYPEVFHGASIFYWFVAPAAGLFLSSREMEEYSSLYMRLSFISVPAVLIYLTWILTGRVALLALSITLTGLAQTLSLVKASELDENLRI